MKCWLSILVVLYSTTVAAQNYEVPTVYKMEEAIPANLRSSKEYKIGNIVGHNGYLYLINVNSIYGSYSVKGLASLENLAYELQVLTSLQELASSKVFLDAAGQSGVNVVFAPLKTVGGLVDAVANPSETWDTIKKVPAGVEGIFTWAKNRVVSGAEDVSDALSSDEISEEDKPKKDTTGLASKGAGSAEKFGLDYLGYNELRRAWCEKTSIDPNTENQPLRDRIARLAEVETAVKIGFKFVPGIDMGAAAKAKGYMEKTKKVSLYADPYYASDQNKLILKEMGMSDDEIKGLTKNKNFSGTMVTLLVAQLDELSDVGNRNAILNNAAEITSKEGALYLVQSIKYLVQLQSEGTKFTKFLVGAHVPAALTSGGELIIPLALDRIIWTQLIAETLDDIIVRTKSEKDIKRLKLVCSGKLSSKLKEELTKNGFQFSELIPMAL